MERDAIIRAMPAIRQRFEDLKAALREGRLPEATRFLDGTCIAWGEALADMFEHGGRAELAGQDPLTRFFVTRLRGMPGPADIADAPGAARFLMAFTAFPYLDALVEETAIGDWVAGEGGGPWRVSRVLAGELTDDTLAVLPGPGGAWRFDLMDLYQAKAMALEDFITQRWQGDFDAFLRAYVADHDLVFDVERAWTPRQPA